MNYLTALFAFSAIMIVLSTLATVVVEFVHKLMRRRAKDFEQLLSQLYSEAIAPRLVNAGVQVSAKVDDFVRDVRRNPAFDAGGSAGGSRWAIVRRFFDTSFEQLSTREFVEQFAQTDAGKKLQKESQDVKKALISKFAYEFERYGDAATNYFKRRATTLSVAVAFVLAFFLNVDALRLFGALAHDSDLANTVIASIDVEQMKSDYEQRLEDAQSEQEKRDIRAEFKAARDAARQQAEALEGLGLPVGLAYFPFCESGSGSGDGLMVDARCKDVAAPTFENEWKLVGGAVTFVGVTAENAWKRVLSTRAGWGWMFSIVVAGGLIGLGAPFWFKTYSFLGNFIPGFRQGDRTQARQDASGQGRQAVAQTSAGGTAGAITMVTTATGAGAPARAAALAAPAGGSGGSSSAASATPVAPVATFQVPVGQGLTAGDLFEAFDACERE